MIMIQMLTNIDDNDPNFDNTNINDNDPNIDKYCRHHHLCLWGNKSIAWSGSLPLTQ